FLEAAVDVALIGTQFENVSVEYVNLALNAAEVIVKILIQGVESFINPFELFVHRIQPRNDHTKLIPNLVKPFTHSLIGLVNSLISLVKPFPHSLIGLVNSLISLGKAFSHSLIGLSNSLISLG